MLIIFLPSITCNPNNDYHIMSLANLQILASVTKIKQISEMYKHVQNAEVGDSL